MRFTSLFAVLGGLAIHPGVHVTAAPCERDELLDIFQSSFRDADAYCRNRFGMLSPQRNVSPSFTSAIAGYEPGALCSACNCLTLPVCTPTTPPAVSSTTAATVTTTTADTESSTTVATEPEPSTTSEPENQAFLLTSADPDTGETLYYMQGTSESNGTTLEILYATTDPTDPPTLLLDPSTQLLSLDSSNPLGRAPPNPLYAFQFLPGQNQPVFFATAADIQFVGGTYFQWAINPFSFELALDTGPNPPLILMLCPNNVLTGDTTYTNVLTAGPTLEPGCTALDLEVVYADEPEPTTSTAVTDPVTTTSTASLSYVITETSTNLVPEPITTTDPESSSTTVATEPTTTVLSESTTVIDPEPTTTTEISGSSTTVATEPTTTTDVESTTTAVSGSTTVAEPEPTTTTGVSESSTTVATEPTTTTDVEPTISTTDTQPTSTAGPEPRNFRLYSINSITGQRASYLQGTVSGIQFDVLYATYEVDPPEQPILALGDVNFSTLSIPSISAEPYFAFDWLSGQGSPVYFQTADTIDLAGGDYLIWEIDPGTSELRLLTVGLVLMLCEQGLGVNATFSNYLTVASVLQFGCEDVNLIVEYITPDTEPSTSTTVPEPEPTTTTGPIEPTTTNVSESSTTVTDPEPTTTTAVSESSTTVPDSELTTTTTAVSESSTTVPDSESTTTAASESSTTVPDSESTTTVASESSATVPDSESTTTVTSESSTTAPDSESTTTAASESSTTVPDSESTTTAASESSTTVPDPEPTTTTADPEPTTTTSDPGNPTAYPDLPRFQVYSLDSTSGERTYYREAAHENLTGVHILYSTQSSESGRAEQTLLFLDSVTTAQLFLVNDDDPASPFWSFQYPDNVSSPAWWASEADLQLYSGRPVPWRMSLNLSPAEVYPDPSYGYVLHSCPTDIYFGNPTYSNVLTFGQGPIDPGSGCTPVTLYVEYVDDPQPTTTSTLSLPEPEPTITIPEPESTTTGPPVDPTTSTETEGPVDSTSMTEGPVNPSTSTETEGPVNSTSMTEGPVDSSTSTETEGPVDSTSMTEGPVNPSTSTETEGPVNSTSMTEGPVDPSTSTETEGPVDSTSMTEGPVVPSTSTETEGPVDSTSMTEGPVDPTTTTTETEPATTETSLPELRSFRISSFDSTTGSREYYRLGTTDFVQVLYATSEVVDPEDQATLLLNSSYLFVPGSEPTRYAFNVAEDSNPVYFLPSQIAEQINGVYLEWEIDPMGSRLQLAGNNLVLMLCSGEVNGFSNYLAVDETITEGCRSVALLIEYVTDGPETSTTVSDPSPVDPTTTTSDAEPTTTTTSVPECVLNRDCPSLAECVSLGGTVCRGGVCQCEFEPLCLTDADCPELSECLGRGGTVCTNQLCQCLEPLEPTTIGTTDLPGTLTTTDVLPTDLTSTTQPPDPESSSSEVVTDPTTTTADIPGQTPFRIWSTDVDTGNRINYRQVTENGLEVLVATYDPNVELASLATLTLDPNNAILQLAVSSGPNLYYGFHIPVDGDGSPIYFQTMSVIQEAGGFYLPFSLNPQSSHLTMMAEGLMLMLCPGTQGNYIYVGEVVGDGCSMVSLSIEYVTAGEPTTTTDPTTDSTTSTGISGPTPFRIVSYDVVSGDKYYYQQDLDLSAVVLYATPESTGLEINDLPTLLFDQAEPYLMLASTAGSDPRFAFRYDDPEGGSTVLFHTALAIENSEADYLTFSLKTETSELILVDPERQLMLCPRSLYSGSTEHSSYLSVGTSIQPGCNPVSLSVEYSRAEPPPIPTFVVPPFRLLADIPTPGGGGAFERTYWKEGVALDINAAVLYAEFDNDEGRYLPILNLEPLTGRMSISGSYPPMYAINYPPDGEDGPVLFATEALALELGAEFLTYAVELDVGSAQMYGIGNAATVCEDSNVAINGSFANYFSVGRKYPPRAGCSGFTLGLWAEFIASCTAVFDCPPCPYALPPRCEEGSCRCFGDAPEPGQPSVTTTTGTGVVPEPTTTTTNTPESTPFRLVDFRRDPSTGEVQRGYWLVETAGGFEFFHANYYDVDGPAPPIHVEDIQRIIVQPATQLMYLYGNPAFAFDLYDGEAGPVIFGTSSEISDALGDPLRWIIDPLTMAVTLDPSQGLGLYSCLDTPFPPSGEYTNLLSVLNGPAPGCEPVELHIEYAVTCDLSIDCPNCPYSWAPVCLNGNCECSGPAPTLPEPPTTTSAEVPPPASQTGQVPAGTAFRLVATNSAGTTAYFQRGTEGNGFEVLPVTYVIENLDSRPEARLILDPAAPNRLALPYDAANGDEAWYAFDLSQGGGAPLQFINPNENSFPLLSWTLNQDTMQLAAANDIGTLNYRFMICNYNPAFQNSNFDYYLTVWPPYASPVIQGCETVSLKAEYVECVVANDCSPADCEAGFINPTCSSTGQCVCEPESTPGPVPIQLPHFRLRANVDGMQHYFLLGTDQYYNDYGIIYTTTYPENLEFYDQVQLALDPQSYGLLMPVTTDVLTPNVDDRVYAFSVMGRNAGPVFFGRNPEILAVDGRLVTFNVDPSSRRLTVVEWNGMVDTEVSERWRLLLCSTNLATGTDQGGFGSYLSVEFALPGSPAPAGCTVIEDIYAESTDCFYTTGCPAEACISGQFGVCIQGMCECFE